MTKRAWLLLTKLPYVPDLISVDENNRSLTMKKIDSGGEKSVLPRKTKLRGFLKDSKKIPDFITTTLKHFA